MKKDKNTNKTYLKYIFILFILVFALNLIFNFLFADSQIYADAMNYWELGKSLWKNGHFSFYNLETGFRGYFFPFFLGIFGQIFSWSRWSYIIAYSILAGILFAAIIPKLIITDKEWDKNIDLKFIVRGIICYIIFMLFFCGLLYYPLSDIFAIFICMLTVVFANKILSEDNPFKLFILSICFGAGLYLAYNVRTIYMFASIYLVLVYGIKILKNSAWLKKILSILGGGLGFGIASIPQIIINRNLLNIISLKVPTNSLMLTQLSWGLMYQRYDTYIGAQQNIPQMYFLDSVGNKILQAEGLTQGIQTWSDYFHIALKYPFEMLGIYVRHLVNMLLPVFPNQYVLDLDNNKIWLAVLSFTCFYLFAVAHLVHKVNMSRKTFINFVPLFITMLFILPGAVEVRFFAGLYIYILGVLCYNVRWKQLFEYIKVNKAKIALSYCAIFGIFMAMWSAMLASETAYDLFLW